MIEPVVPKVNVRIATLKDYPKVKEIQKKGYGKIVWNLTDILMEHLFIGGRAYIIEYNHTSIGFLHIRKRRYIQRHITNICILPDYQGKGIGTEVLDRVKEWNKEDNINLLTLHVRETNTRAKKLYQNQGFVEVNRIKRYYKDTGEDAFKMKYTSK